MNVVMCSAFRNASAYIPRYFAQVESLERLLFLQGDNLSLILGYGDSTDNTESMLFEETSGGIGARLIDVSHGGQAFTSVVDAERFRQLAYIGNRIFANVPQDADAVIWVEGDLIWQGETLLRLIDHLADVPCVAPMIMEISTGGFYDIWAFRKDGVNFTKAAPYHPGIDGRLVKMDSVGSCVAMFGEIVHMFTVPEADVIVGLCRQINEGGGSVWLDSSLEIQHT